VAGNSARRLPNGVGESSRRCNRPYRAGSAMISS